MMLDDRSYMREPEWHDAPRSGWVWSTVKILLVINVAVFLVLNIIFHYGSDALGGFVQQFMILKSGAVKSGIEYMTGESLSSGQVLGIWDGAVWQLFTYQFMHFGLWHILCNMIGLYFIGKAIEEMYGGGVMLKLYLLGGVCGGLLETGMTWFGHSPDFGIVTMTLIMFAAAAAAQSLPAPDDVAAVPAGADTTGSGLAYRVLQSGTGSEYPTATSNVTVHYSGWLTDGSMFDSSVTRGQPSSFPLNRVISGWTEGVQLMVVGEKRRFWIPSDLAYGSRGRPGIPPNSLLVFDIELIDIR